MPFISPQTEAIRDALEQPNRTLLHCLNCGGQVVAVRHDDQCRICGSAAFLIEEVE